MGKRAALVQETQDRLAWPRQKALFGTQQTVLVDGPSADSAFLVVVETMRKINTTSSTSISETMMTDGVFFRF